MKISSAGPAGGPIQRLNWENNTLTINHDQEISITPVPEPVLFQDEREALTIKKERSSNRWHSEDGFSTALLILSGNKKYSLDITSKSKITHSADRTNNCLATEEQRIENAVYFTVPGQQATNDIRRKCSEFQCLHTPGG